MTSLVLIASAVRRSGEGGEGERGLVVPDDIGDAGADDTVVVVVVKVDSVVRNSMVSFSIVLSAAFVWDVYRWTVLHRSGERYVVDS